MIKLIFKSILAISVILSAGCTKQEDQPKQNIPSDPKEETGFIEAVPETISFSNAEFIYHGDDVGESLSDGWVIKFYSDMETDESGAPIGPGCVIQLLLNVRFDPQQAADPSFLPETYSTMASSIDFTPGTFVNGYISYVDLPGGRIELADATFYADVKDGSTEMEYDLIDEGIINITDEGNGIYGISGILIGTKFTKRYFTWKGSITPKNDAPQETPNSTITSDLTGLVLTKGQLQDKGDYFYLRDESYRCYLLFLGSDGIDLTTSKPGGTGDLLRLEVLVPWENSLENGIPAGTYTMIPRNHDTSLDKDDIKPGAAITGLPNRFSYPYIAGSWYISMNNGQWSDTYARIDSGTISISRDEEGRHTISYDLQDCQNPARSIKGSHTLHVDIFSF